MRSRSPTTPSTACPVRSAAATSTAPWASRGGCVPATSPSTASRTSASAAPSAAPNKADWAAATVTRATESIWRARRSDCPTNRSRGWLALGGELAAGGGDLATAGVADGAGHPALADPLDEFPLGGLGAGIPLATRRRVERDDVDVYQRPERPVQFLAEQIATPRLVVDVANEGVFDRDAATG